MKPGWLDSDRWHEIQESVPVACVDVLPLQFEAKGKGSNTAVGLIFRETPHQGRRWCLVGGRIFRNESLTEAVSDQLRDALGEEIQFELEQEIQPHYVAQYFDIPRAIGGFDPRQHAIGLTYCVQVKGAIHARGEALSFAWFHPRRLPAPEEFGFDQDRVVAACLARLNLL